jgi:hypothetical protein
MLPVSVILPGPYRANRGQVSKSAGNIRFRSDAGGNRIVKETGDDQQYYIRDAQGNIIVPVPL